MKTELAACIRHYNQKGWSPATSTNYSFKDEQAQLWVSRSGIDKSQFNPEDFIPIYANGQVLAPFEAIKASDETGIHTWIYSQFPEATVVLHSHSKFPVMLSNCYEDYVSFEGYELLKGFKGVRSHDVEVRIPIVANSQEMPVLCQELAQRFDELQFHCFIIAGHGTYAWGTSLFEAKRHLETLDYLCECEFLM
ncbi:MAG: hypothetical protein RLZZ301_1432 [Bacteroidota bacterium]